MGMYKELGPRNKDFELRKHAIYLDRSLVEGS